MKRHLTFRLSIHAAIALLLFLVQAQSAQATLVAFTWTADEIMNAYDTAAAVEDDGYSKYDVGLLDLYARPDDPDVGNYATVAFPAPTFNGSPTNPWAVATPATAAVEAGGPWTVFTDKADSPVVYVTAFTGAMFVYQSSLDEFVPALRYQGSAKFTILLDVSASVAAQLTGPGASPVNFRVGTYRSIFGCNGVNYDCQTGTEAYSFEKTTTPFFFSMSDVGELYTPEPSTMALGVFGLTALGLLRRRRNS